VYCNEKDKESVKNYKVKEANILGGVIAESKDGMLRVDYSYDLLLKQLKDELLPQLNKMLFHKK